MKLAVLKLPCEFDGAAALTTLLTHTSGEWVETSIKLSPMRNEPQGVGSVLTLGERESNRFILADSRKPIGWFRKVCVKPNREELQ